MQLSKYFLPLLKEDPKEASIASHRYMLRAGMIRQLTAGIYNWLPLGLKVLKKVETIIREEMDRAGAIEILMPCIQPVELWKRSGRYGTGDDLSTQMLRIKDRNDNDLTFTPTAEEVITELFGNNIQSYKDLPKTLYQIAWKFRDEIRPRFGVMRGREFLMKDAYSFHLNEESAIATYKNMIVAYLRAYSRMGLTAIPVAASTGSMGGNYSHEFHILAETGESKIFYEEEALSYLANNEFTLEGFAKYYANEEEKYDPQRCPVPESKLITKRGIEVGHVFFLGNKYTKTLNIAVQNHEGKLVHPEMGCYGIGVSRLVGAIIEANHDEHGIIWPETITPFHAGIINLKPGDEKCIQASQELYNKLQNAGKDILYDDTHDSAGVKFSRMDLIGLPYIIAIGPKGIKENKAELKIRRTNEKHGISTESVLNKILL